MTDNFEYLNSNLWPGIPFYVNSLGQRGKVINNFHEPFPRKPCLTLEHLRKLDFDEVH